MLKQVNRSKKGVKTSCFNNGLTLIHELWALGECEMGMSAAVGPVMGATAVEGVTGECEMGDTTEYAPRATNTHRARHACYLTAHQALGHPWPVMN